MDDFLEESLEGKVGPVVGADGTENNLRQSKRLATVVTRAHGKYYEAVSRGNVYFIAAQNLVPKIDFSNGAFSLIHLVNPLRSNKNLIMLSLNATIRTSAVASTSLDLCGTITTLARFAPIINPTNLYTQIPSGSVVNGYVNSVASAFYPFDFIFSVKNYYNTTPARGTFLSNSYNDLGGMSIVPPGYEVGVLPIFGSSTETYDVSLIWEEVSI